MSTLRDRFMAKVSPEPNSGCWLWTAHTGRGGYGRLRTDDGVKETHRLSYELFCEAIPEDACVLHRCDVRSCVNPDHLFLGDRAANIADMIAKGRAVNLKGTAHGRSKLDKVALQKIRSCKHRVADLAREYGVTRRTIYNVLDGVTYMGAP
jgi:HNH endonuclease